MIRIAVYPYNDDCSVFSDYVDMLSEKYAFSEAASPRSWGFTGKSIMTSDGEDTVKVSTKNFTKNNDILLIPDFTIEPIAEKGILKEIMYYVPSISRVICCADLTEKSIAELKNFCERSNCEFFNSKDYSHGAEEAKNLGYEEKRYAYLDSTDYYRAFKDVSDCDVPVAVVSGEWESTDKFAVQLSLLRGLRKNGYKVSMIGSNFYSIFFGVNCFPTFMFCETVNEANKPHIFSRYVKRISMMEEPDIIIVGIPGSAQPYNRAETDRFGMMPYMTFQGLEPDYFIFTSIYRNDSRRILEELSNMCRYKYGVTPDMIHMSDLVISTDDDYDFGISLEKTDRENVDRVIEEEYGEDNEFVMNILAKDNDDKVVEHLVNKLSGVPKVAGCLI